MHTERKKCSRCSLDYFAFQNKRLTSRFHLHYQGPWMCNFMIKWEHAYAHVLLSICLYHTISNPLNCEARKPNCDRNAFPWAANRNWSLIWGHAKATPQLLLQNMTYGRNHVLLPVSIAKAALFVSSLMCPSSPLTSSLNCSFTVLLLKVRKGGTGKAIYLPYLHMQSVKISRQRCTVSPLLPVIREHWQTAIWIYLCAFGDLSFRNIKKQIAKLRQEKGLRCLCMANPYSHERCLMLLFDLFRISFNLYPP